MMLINKQKSHARVQKGGQMSAHEEGLFADPRNISHHNKLADASFAEHHYEKAYQHYSLSYREDSSQVDLLLKMAAAKFNMAMDHNLASLGHGRGDPGSMSLSQASMHLKEYQTKVDALVEGDGKKKRSAFWAAVGAFEATTFLAFSNRELAKQLFEMTSGPALKVVRGPNTYQPFEERVLEQISLFPSSFVLHHRLLSYWLLTSQISHIIRHIVQFNSASTGLPTNIEWTTWCSEFFDSLAEQALVPDSPLNDDDWQPFDFQDILIWRLKLKHQRCLNALSTPHFSDLVRSFTDCLANTSHILGQEAGDVASDPLLAHWVAYQSEFEAVSASLDFRALLLQSLAVSDRTSLMQDAWDALSHSWEHPDMQKLVSWSLSDHLWFYMDWPSLDNEVDIARLQRYSQDVKLTYLLLLSSTPAGRRMTAAKSFLKSPLGAGLNFDVIRLPPFSTPQDMLQLALKLDMIILTHCGEILGNFDAVSKQLHFYFEAGMPEAISVIFDYVLQAHRANVITNLDFTTFLLLNYALGDERLSSNAWSTPLSSWITQIVESTPTNVSPISLPETKQLWSSMVAVLTGKEQNLDLQSLAIYTSDSASAMASSSKSLTNGKQNILNPTFNANRKVNGFSALSTGRPFSSLAQSLNSASNTSKTSLLPDYKHFNSQKAGLSLSSHSIFLAVVQKMELTLLGSLASDRPSATSSLSTQMDQLLHILEWYTHRLSTSSNSPFKTGSFSLASEAISPESVVLSDSPLTTIALPQYQTSEWMSSQQAAVYLLSHVLSFSKHMQLPTGVLQSLAKNLRAVHANPDAMLSGAEAMLILLSSADPETNATTVRDALIVMVQSIHTFMTHLAANMDDLSRSIMKETSSNFETRLQKLDAIVQRYTTPIEQKVAPATPSKTPIPVRSIQDSESGSSNSSKNGASSSPSQTELQNRFLERLNGALASLSKAKSQNIELPAIELEYLKLFSTATTVASRSLSPASIAAPIAVTARYVAPKPVTEPETTKSREPTLLAPVPTAKPSLGFTGLGTSSSVAANATAALMPGDTKGVTGAVAGEMAILQSAVDAEKQELMRMMQEMARQREEAAKEAQRLQAMMDSSQQMQRQLEAEQRNLQAQREALATERQSFEAIKQSQLDSEKKRQAEAKRIVEEERRKIEALMDGSDDEADSNDSEASETSAVLAPTAPTATTPQKAFGFGNSASSTPSGSKFSFAAKSTSQSDLTKPFAFATKSPGFGAKSEPANVESPAPAPAATVPAPAASPAAEAKPSADSKFKFGSGFSKITPGAFGAKTTSAAPSSGTPPAAATSSEFIASTLTAVPSIADKASTAPSEPAKPSVGFGFGLSAAKPTAASTAPEGPKSKFGTGFANLSGGKFGYGKKTQAPENPVAEAEKPSTQDQSPEKAVEQVEENQKAAEGITSSPAEAQALNEPSAEAASRKDVVDAATEAGFGDDSFSEGSEEDEESRKEVEKAPANDVPEAEKESKPSESPQETQPEEPAKPKQGFGFGSSGGFAKPSTGGFGFGSSSSSTPKFGSGFGLFSKPTASTSKPALEAEKPKSKEPEISSSQPASDIASTSSTSDTTKESTPLDEPSSESSARKDMLEAASGVSFGADYDFSVDSTGDEEEESPKSSGSSSPKPEVPTGVENAIQAELHHSETSQPTNTTHSATSPLAEKESTPPAAEAQPSEPAKPKQGFGASGGFAKPSTGGFGFSSSSSAPKFGSFTGLGKPTDSTSKPALEVEKPKSEELEVSASQSASDIASTSSASDIAKESTMESTAISEESKIRDEPSSESSALKEALKSAAAIGFGDDDDFSAGGSDGEEAVPKGLIPGREPSTSTTDASESNKEVVEGETNAVDENETSLEVTSEPSAELHKDGDESVLVGVPANSTTAPTLTEEASSSPNDVSSSSDALSPKHISEASEPASGTITTVETEPSVTEPAIDATETDSNSSSHSWAVTDEPSSEVSDRKNMLKSASVSGFGDNEEDFSVGSDGEEEESAKSGFLPGRESSTTVVSESINEEVDKNTVDDTEPSSLEATSDPLAEPSVSASSSPEAVLDHSKESALDEETSETIMVPTATEEASSSPNDGSDASVPVDSLSPANAPEVVTTTLEPVGETDSQFIQAEESEAAERKVVEESQALALAMEASHAIEAAKRDQALAAASEEISHLVQEKTERSSLDEPASSIDPAESNKANPIEGGSLGSSAVNEAADDAISALLEERPTSRSRSQSSHAPTAATIEPSKIDADLEYHEAHRGEGSVSSLEAEFAPGTASIHSDITPEAELLQPSTISSHELPGSVEPPALVETQDSPAFDAL
jgi:hypothetical protein